jgi:hypothetical protein
MALAVATKPGGAEAAFGTARVEIVAVLMLARPFCGARSQGHLVCI